MLVILRAGDTSLHPTWLEEDKILERNWDLHLSYYGNQDDPFSGRPLDVTLTREKGPKAKGIVDCLKKLGKRLDHYGWIWLPDDDLACKLSTLNKFFQIVMSNSFELSQPALAEGSFFSHEITKQKPAFRWRYTSFVEIMCPCFSRSAFLRCRPYLGATESSWGIDLLFPKLIGYPERGIAIVDETPILHTRPPSWSIPPAAMRQVNYAIAAGIDPADEVWRLLRDHGFSESATWPYHTDLLREYAAVDHAGRLIIFCNSNVTG